jgi:hypothetical protein
MRFCESNLLGRESPGYLRHHGYVKRQILANAQELLRYACISLLYMTMLHTYGRTTWRVSDCYERLVTVAAADVLATPC